MQLSTSKTENGKTKHRSGSEDVCRSYMYMPESKSVVQVVRRNSSLELPVGHDLFHLTFKSEQHAETHRIVRDKFKNSAAYEKLSGNSENHRQIRGKRAWNDDHAESWPQCERDGHKRMAAWSHGRPSWSQSERTLRRRALLNTGRLRLKMQKIHRVNLVRLNLLKSREIIERHWICPRRNRPGPYKKNMATPSRATFARGSASWRRFTRDS